MADEVCGCDPPLPLQMPDHYELTADLPGFKKDEVNVEVHHGVLRIAAERSNKTEADEERDGVKWHRVERTAGSLYRQVKLPAGADVDRISARSENGVLTVSIAKRPEAIEAPPKRVDVA